MFTGVLCAILIVITCIRIYASQKEISKVGTQFNNLSSDDTYTPPIPALSQQQLQQSPRSDFVWYAGRPTSAPYAGWEDEWMSAWKNANYSPLDRAYCEQDDTSPYRDGANPNPNHLCHVPAYTPARIPQPPVPPTGIPRVIFISWMTRKVSSRFFTSVLTLLHHNPEYELIFFTDADMDQFVCDGYPPPDMAAEYSTLRTGAARVDVWRMLLIERYGGVYLDADTSALGPLPIENDVVAAVSGVGCWGHLPTDVNGVFAHWTLAYAPHHPLMGATIEELRANLRDPKRFEEGGSYWEGKEDRQEDSFTVITTGPGPYQTALHRLLKECGCEHDEGGDYCDTLWDPKRYCGGNYSAFLQTFGNITMTDTDSNLTLTSKLLQGNGENDGIMGHVQDYDRPALRPGPVDANFCSPEAFGERKLDAERRWNQSLV